jgi:hypothetical protein
MPGPWPSDDDDEETFVRRPGSRPVASVLAGLMAVFLSLAALVLVVPLLLWPLGFALVLWMSLPRP